jgi:hypothetical protein
LIPLPTLLKVNNKQNAAKLDKPQKQNAQTICYITKKRNKILHIAENTVIFA